MIQIMKQVIKPCQIYLIRHGQTQANTTGILQGQEDSPLTDEGIKEIKNRAKELKKINFSAFYSSDTLRAKRTAELIAAEHKLIVSTTELIRERHFGNYEGKHYTEYQKDFKELLTIRESLSKTDRMKFRLADNIETDEDTITRLIRFIREVSLDHPNETIGVVSHGGVIRAFLIHLGWASYQTLPPGTIDNVAYVKLESDGIEFNVINTKGLHRKE